MLEELWCQSHPSSTAEKEVIESCAEKFAPNLYGNINDTGE